MLKISTHFLKSKKQAILIIILATFLVYSNIFANGFVLDDSSFITDWPQIQSLSNIPVLVSGQVPYIHQGVYRPIRSILYVLYHQLWGANPIGYHLHGAIVIIASAVLVYLIFERIFKKKSLALVGGLLYGLHPAHTESITYISASMEMTGVIFFLLSFYLYLRSKYLLSVLFALLAFFTYEMTLTLPILILLYDWCFGRLSLKKERVFKVYLPYFLAALSFAFIRVFLLHITSRGDYLAYSFPHTMMTMSKVFISYIQLIIFPFNISYIHELAPGFESFMTKYSNQQSILNQSFLDPPVLFSLALIGGSIIWALLKAKKWPLLGFGILWFYISLLPVSYLFPQGIALAEKYLYIPSFGIILILVYLADLLVSRYPRFKTQALAATIIIVLVLGYLTYARNRDWHDPTTFWLRVAQQHPQSSLAYYTLGVLYGEGGEVSEAAGYYRKAIVLEPRFWEAMYNLGNIYLEQGEGSLAADQYQKVLLLQPEFAQARDDLKLAENSSGNSVYSDSKLSFSYPKGWKVTSAEGITVTDSHGFIINIRFEKLTSGSSSDYLDNQTEGYGILQEQGLASIPGYERSYIKIFNDRGVQKNLFYLFKGNDVVRLLVYPADSPLMSEFDKVVSSINFK